VEYPGIIVSFPERDPVPLCSSRESVKAENGAAKMTPIPSRKSRDAVSTNSKGGGYEKHEEMDRCSVDACGLR
jgi:hypothetical protein